MGNEDPPVQPEKHPPTKDDVPIDTPVVPEHFF